MTIFVKNKHTLIIDEFVLKCCIGKNGSVIKKKEGDKKTPKGTFKIENLYYRKDRIKRPETQLKCVQITNKMGWCNDIKFPKVKKNKPKPSLRRKSEPTINKKAKSFLNKTKPNKLISDSEFIFHLPET